LANGNYADIGPTMLVKHYSMFHFNGSVSAANRYPTDTITLNQRWPNYCLLVRLLRGSASFGQM